MKCSETEQRLAPYLMGELQGPVRDGVRQHLDGCPVCRALSQDLKKTLDLLSGALADGSGVPARLSAEHRARIFATPPAGQRIAWVSWLVSSHPSLAAAASLVVLLGFGWLLVANLRAPDAGRGAVPPPVVCDKVAEVDASGAKVPTGVPGGLETHDFKLSEKLAGPAGDRVPAAPAAPSPSRPAAPVEMPAAPTAALASVPEPAADDRVANAAPAKLAGSAGRSKAAREHDGTRPSRSPKSETERVAPPASTPAPVAGVATEPPADRWEADAPTPEPVAEEAKERLRKAEPAKQADAPAPSATRGAAGGGLAYGLTARDPSRPAQAVEALPADAITVEQAAAEPALRREEGGARSVVVDGREAQAPAVVKPDGEDSRKLDSGLRRRQVVAADEPAAAMPAAVAESRDLARRDSGAIARKGAATSGPTLAAQVTCEPVGRVAGAYRLAIALTARAVSPPQWVASNVTVRVQLNPALVRSIRRVGGEGPVSRPVELGDLLAGQSRTVGYDIELGDLSSRPSDEAVVTLWVRFRRVLDGTDAEQVQRLTVAEVRACGAAGRAAGAAGPASGGTPGSDKP